jgi:hypothetical protein
LTRNDFQSRFRGRTVLPVLCALRACFRSFSAPLSPLLSKSCEPSGDDSVACGPATAANPLKTLDLRCFQLFFQPSLKLVPGNRARLAVCAVSYTILYTTIQGSPSSPFASSPIPCEAP